MTTGGAFVRAPVPARGPTIQRRDLSKDISSKRHSRRHRSALQHLLDAGVITQAEFQELRARVIK